MSVPPGWPAEVPPPTVEGWQRPAVQWLLDLCPSEHRGQAILMRHPVVLARVTLEHVRAAVQTLRQGYARARVEFRDVLDQQQIDEVLAFYETEGRRLVKAEAAVLLVEGALRGRTYAPKL